jgi:hypothetical protein
MVGPAAKREAVAHLRGVLEMSERRACTIVAADRKMIPYRSRRPPDTELRARLREPAFRRWAAGSRARKWVPLNTYTQFSIRSPFIRRNSRGLLLTRIKPSLRAWPPIIMS